MGMMYIKAKVKQREMYLQFNASGRDTDKDFITEKYGVKRSDVSIQKRSTSSKLPSWWKG